MSADGSRVALGAYGNDDNGQEAGKVRIFEWNGTDWVQLGNDIHGKVAGDNIGAKLKLSSDGNSISFSSINNPNGFRVYQWSGISWEQKGTDVESTPNDLPMGSTSSSLDMSSDGNRVVVGNPFIDTPTASAGRVRVFEWSGTEWFRLASDIDGDEENEYCGKSVSLNSDGSILAVSHGFESRVYYLSDDTLTLPVINISANYQSDPGADVVIDATPIAGFPTDFDYKWYFNGAIIPTGSGGENPSITINGQLSKEGSWRVEVTNIAGTVSAEFQYMVMGDTDQDGLSDYRETSVYGTNPALSDTDGDQLDDYAEIHTHNTDPTLADSSGDDIEDGEALAAGFDPLVDYSSLVSVVTSNPQRFNLYDKTGIMDLRMNGLMMQKVGSSIEISFKIQKRDNIVEGEWVDYETVTRSIELPDAQSFIRLQADSP
jgi:hypothetical protein